MKKAALLGLALLFGSTTSYAAPTSLSTSGTWETATGSLSGLLGQAAPATWSYDTTIFSSAPTSPLPSGGSLSFLTSPNYIISGTSSFFDGNNFTIEAVDNSIASLDVNPAFTDFFTSMSNEGVNPNAIGDVFAFSTTKHIAQEGFYTLFGIMIFDENYFSGPITELPTGQSLLDNALFTYASLTHRIDLGQGFEEVGFASYAEAPAAVPVPAAAYLFAPALLGFLGLRRKSKV